MDYSKCMTIESSSKIVVRENRSSFELINDRKYKVEKIQVDGCLITGDKERCDWLLVVKSAEATAHFVELKGSDLKKAISQLGATLNDTKEHLKKTQRRCYAVTTRVPKQGPSVQKLAQAFYKEHAVLLIVKNIRASVKVDS